VTTFLNELLEAELWREIADIDKNTVEARQETQRAGLDIVDAMQV